MANPGGARAPPSPPLAPPLGTKKARSAFECRVVSGVPKTLIHPYHKHVMTDRIYCHHVSRCPKQVQYHIPIIRHCIITSKNCV